MLAIIAGGSPLLGPTLTNLMIHLSQHPQYPPHTELSLDVTSSRKPSLMLRPPPLPPQVSYSSTIAWTAPIRAQVTSCTPFYNWGILWLLCHTENSLRPGQSQFHICTSNLASLVWCLAHGSAHQRLGGAWAWESGKSRMDEGVERGGAKGDPTRSLYPRAIVLVKFSIAKYCLCRRND